MTIEQQLWQHICKSYINEEDAKSLDPKCNLIEEGVLDSLAIMGLIAYIEKTYQIKIERDEVVKENFSSLAGLSSLISRKKT